MNSISKIVLFTALIFCSSPRQSLFAQHDGSSRPEQQDELAEALSAQQTKDYDRAFALFSKAAAKGNSRAMLHLSTMYISGQGAEKNTSEALRWAKTALDKKDADAMVQLGLIYALQKDYKEASKSLKKAASGISRISSDYAVLASMLYQNYVMPREYYDDGLVWHETRAELGDVEAMKLAGHIHRESKNYKSAIYWLKKAVENDDKFLSMLRLAEVYSDKEAGSYRNETEAEYWYRKAADRGSTTGMYYTGLYLYRKKNYEAALDWLLKAKEKRYPADPVSLIFHIAECNFYLKNYGEAMDNYEEVYDHVYAKGELKRAAATQISVMYEKGLGVSKDPKEAFLWKANAASAK